MSVLKYNIFKGVSTLLTVGTPLTVLALNGELIRQRPATAMSAAGIFAVIISLLFFKDKIAENWKMPSAAVLAGIVFIFLEMVEAIIGPMKDVCICTALICGIDELTFKHFFKIEAIKMGDAADAYKHFGFIFARTDTVEELKNEKGCNGNP